MKHKNKLIVPTLITTSLLTSSLVANADEIADETSDRTEGEITVGEEIKQVKVARALIKIINKRERAKI